MSITYYIIKRKYSKLFSIRNPAVVNTSLNPRSKVDLNRCKRKPDSKFGDEVWKWTQTWLNLLSSKIKKKVKFTNTTATNRFIFQQESDKQCSRKSVNCKYNEIFYDWINVTILLPQFYLPSVSLIVFDLFFSVCLREW